MSDVRVAIGRTPLVQSIAATPVQPVRPDAWLLELERARWRAQPRYDGAPRDDALPAQAMEIEQKPSQAADPRQAGVRELAPPAGAAQELAPIAGRDAQPSPAAVRPAAIAVPSRDAVLFAGALPAATPTRSAATPASSAPAAATPRPASAGTTWQSRSVHVHVGEQSTAVWIRDARLLPHEAVRLLEQLRPLLGHAPQAYAALRLTVNGQAVVNPHHPQERSHAH